MIRTPKIPNRIKATYIPVKKISQRVSGGLTKKVFEDQLDDAFKGVVLPEKKERTQGEAGTYISTNLKLYIDNGVNLKIGDRIRHSKKELTYEIVSEDEYQYAVPNFRKYAVVKKRLSDD